MALRVLHIWPSYKDKYIVHRARLSVYMSEGGRTSGKENEESCFFIFNVKTQTILIFWNVHLQRFYIKSLKPLKANLLYEMILPRRKMFDIPDWTFHNTLFSLYSLLIWICFSLIGNGWWSADKLGGFTRRIRREQGCSTCTYASQTKTWWIRRGWDEKYPWPGNCSMPIPQVILNLNFNMIKK